MRTDVSADELLTKADESRIVRRQRGQKKKTTRWICRRAWTRRGEARSEDERRDRKRVTNARPGDNTQYFEQSLYTAVWVTSGWLERTRVLRELQSMAAMFARRSAGWEMYSDMTDHTISTPTHWFKLWPSGQKIELSNAYALYRKTFVDQRDG